METPSSSSWPSLSDAALLRQRLIGAGLQIEDFDPLEQALVEFVKHNRSKLHDVVSILLPCQDDLNSEASSSSSEEVSADSYFLGNKQQHCDRARCIEWLMFEGDPDAVLTHLRDQKGDTQGVCGAVWGSNDIAYRCRTCEHDPTCAICVACFNAGDHKNHDYSIIHTGGGCCDCGDETAWKSEGFCSMHKGPGQVQPLPEIYAETVGPVLNAVLAEWRDRLLVAERMADGKPRRREAQNVRIKLAENTTSILVEMLLRFCECSESLMNFVAKSVYALSGLLDVLLRTECFLGKEVLAQLHELLFKFLGEPNFKFEFAKAFIKHYPVLFSETLKEGHRDGVSFASGVHDYPSLSNFSVQIFTVPTLTPRLVVEANLLDMLLGNVKQLFISCCGDDGRLVTSKSHSAKQVHIRVVEDIRYVMSHTEVAKYVTSNRPDLSIEWLSLLTFLQGMDAQKRATSINVEEESEHWYSSYILEISMAHIHSFFVNGAASATSVKGMDKEAHLVEKYDSDEDKDAIRHAKIGRLSEESSSVEMIYKSNTSVHEMGDTCFGLKSNVEERFLLPVTAALNYLIYECLKVLGNWLGDEKNSKLGHLVPSESPTHAQVQCNLHVYADHIIDGFFHRRHQAMAISKDAHDDGDRHARAMSGISGNIDFAMDTATDMTHDGDPSGEPLSRQGIEDLSILKLESWPKISYDVSCQEVSFHIPLHRMLSLSLRKAMEMYNDEHIALQKKNSKLSKDFEGGSTFFRKFFTEFHPNGFSACIMEHPLRIQVLCAQVRAGMWRRNSNSTPSLCEYYHSIRWYEESLELDLFLLQCCAAMAPPEAFVRRIVERYNMADYLSLQLSRSNEYESTIVQSMLALLIRIIAERALCGLSTEETLKRELIRRLSIGDATHSHLVRALPLRLVDNRNLQTILNTVASYVKPSGLQQGKYILRNEYWRELDLYHPRWSLRELQAAEERYSLFCKASALVMQLPRWRNPYDALIPLSCIATSRGVLEIIRAVVFYAVYSQNLSESRASEEVLFTAMHLLALGLDICSNFLKIKVLDNKSCGYSDNEEIRSMWIDTTAADDHGHRPPLLCYANERISVGVTGDQQSLLSLLVLLMNKNEKGYGQGVSSEPNNHSITSLIRNMLQKFAELDHGLFHEIQTLAPSVVQNLIPKSECLSTSDSMKRESEYTFSDAAKKKALARERQAAIMAKIKAEQDSFLRSLNCGKGMERTEGEIKQHKSVEVGESQEEPSLVCSLCHELEPSSSIALLSFVQRSRLLSIAVNHPTSWDTCTHTAGDISAEKGGQEDEQTSNSRHEQTLSLVGFWQFFQTAIEGDYNGSPDVEELINILRIDLPVVHRPADQHLGAGNNDIGSIVSRDQRDNLEGHIGRDKEKVQPSSPLNSTRGVSKSVKKGMISPNNDPVSVVLAEYVAHVSNLMSGKRNSPGYQSVRNNMDTVPSVVPSYDGFGPINCDGLHISSCGHAVHQECLERYLLSLRQRHSSRIIFEGVHIVDPEQGEFLCPVCRRLANLILPVLSCKLSLNLHSKFLSPSPSASSSKERTIFQKALENLRIAEEILGKHSYRRTVSCHISGSARKGVESLFQFLCPFYSSFKGSNSIASVRMNHSLIIWDVLRYCLLSAELASRSSKKAFSSLSEIAFDCSKTSVLHLLNQIAQATKSQDKLTVLLRARGLQLIVGSVTLGISRDASCESSMSDYISSLLGHIHEGKSYLDIPFWKRIADPILVHDPFSSLLWILFCMPNALSDTVEAFKAFVHIFYIVCLVQAIAGAGNLFRVELDVDQGRNVFVKDILERVAGTVLDQPSLKFKDSDISSCSTDLVIRRLTLPYLRRCAVLFKLFISSGNIKEASQSMKATLILSERFQQNNDELLVELQEMKMLENLFEIPGLDSILEDGSVHQLVLKWCQHLSSETRARSVRHVAQVKFAYPFELMRLPNLYQDLLQRYIKERCPLCKKVFDEPALCLLCGKVCCARGQSTCCRRNSCVSHAKECGVGFGVFLMTNKTNILLQRSTRQALWPSPYLDAFGEEDLDLQRGKPLYLSKERYAALINMVVSHGLDHNSQVLLQTQRDPGFFL